MVQYAYASGCNQPVGIAYAWMHNDPLGNIGLMTDQSGNVVTTCTQDLCGTGVNPTPNATEFNLPGGSMANITREEVVHVAHLARLELTEDEIERFTPQIDSILGHFHQLQNLDTADIPPTSHAIQLQNVMRPDQSRPSLPVGDVVANAPDRRDGLFVVPRIVET